MMANVITPAEVSLSVAGLALVGVVGNTVATTLIARANSRRQQKESTRVDEQFRITNDRLESEFDRTNKRLDDQAKEERLQKIMSLVTDNSSERNQYIGLRQLRALSIDDIPEGSRGYVLETLAAITNVPLHLASKADASIEFVVSHRELEVEEVDEDEGDVGGQSA